MGALFFSPDGRIGPREFSRAVWPVYLAGMISLFLLCGPVIARGGVFPFAVVHAVLIWCWFALHVKRARDAGSNVPTTVGVGAFYALAIAVVAMVAADVFKGDPEAADRAFFSDPVNNTVPLFAAQIVSEMLSALAWKVWSKPFTNMTDFFYVVLVSLPLTPAFLTTGHSIWLARQPGVPDATSSPGIARTARAVSL